MKLILTKIKLTKGKTDLSTVVYSSSSEESLSRLGLNVTVIVSLQDGGVKGLLKRASPNSSSISNVYWSTESTE